ncbi:glycosyltransferase [Plebeiibacterium sediminum]|uniref:Glycosyltransferase n=1 Tax=Plebeiibacterium sediminum TaxID=2992112 RepID=A0AAE3SEB7_9BACT|nr:glycosyltransferase [Plebeiobacterium sediminum]MCW3786240.1 glycosyltransferase [Plebeiobacterium sediminum]
MKKQKKNICILSKDLVAGGAEKQALMLAKTLNEYHNIYVIVFKNIIHHRNLRYIEENNIPIKVLNGSLFFNLFALFKALKAYHTDVLISYLFKGNVLCGVIGFLAGVKVRIGGVRNAFLKPHKEIFERVMHNHFNTYTIFNNLSGAALYSRRKFNKEKIVVIPNCIISPALIERKDDKIVEILTVGRFVPQKDYLTALKSISLVVKKGINNIHYTIIGWGELKDTIRSWIVELQLEQYVSIVINPTNILDYYKRATIYLSTSLFEGISNTIMEAMSYSLPCVVTDVGDNSRLVKNELNGFILKMKDADGIADALQTLILNFDMRDAYGRNSYQIISQEYSVERFTNEYLKIIDNA